MIILQLFVAIKVLLLLFFYKTYSSIGDERDATAI